jgi:hypothetical protein
VYNRLLNRYAADAVSTNWRCHRRRHTPKRAGQWHEGQQPDDRDDDDHHHHVRIVEIWLATTSAAAMFRCAVPRPGLRL